MLRPVALEHGVPLVLAPRRGHRGARGLVQARQGLDVVAAHRLHALEQRATDRRAERVTVRTEGNGPVLPRTKRQLRALRAVALGRGGDGLTRGHGLPLVQQRGVHGADQRRQPGDNRTQLVRHQLVRHDLAQRPIRIRQVAQHDALGTAHVVTAHDPRERQRVLDHLAHDRLRGNLLILNPRVRVQVHRERIPQQIGQRARPRHLLQGGHALVILHALRLHRGHGLGARRLLLCEQERTRILQDRLDDRHDVQGEGRGLRIQQFEGRQREGGERLVEREVIRQIGGRAQAGLTRGRGLRRRHVLDDARLLHRRVDLAQAAQVGVAIRGRIVVVARQPHEMFARVAPGGRSPCQYVEDHRVCHLEAAGELLGGRVHEALERRARPRDLALARTLALLRGLLGGALGLAGVAGSLLRGAQACALTGGVDLVLGGQDSHETDRVEAGAARAARDLVELARAHVAHAPTVVLHERRHQHRANRHVDAHAQGVRAAHDRQQARLGEALDEATVARQHARVVHANALREQRLEGLPEALRKRHTRQLRGDRLLLLGRNQRGTVKGLRGRHGVTLGEMHDVDRPAALAQQPLHRIGQAVHDVLEFEGHGALCIVDKGHVAPGALLPRTLETRRVAQRRAHRDHLWGPQLQERHLPRPPALTVPVEVELVHDDHVRVQRGPLTQRLIREDLSRAADDGRVGVEGYVAGHHADVIRAEQGHEVKELLRHQGLERRRVIGAAPVRHRREVRGQRDHRLTRPRGGRRNHVVARQDLHQGLLLVRVERTPGALRPGGEGLVQGIVVAQTSLVLQVVQDLVQSRAHTPIVPEWAHVCVRAPPGPSLSSSTRPGHPRARGWPCAWRDVACRARSPVAR